MKCKLCGYKSDYDGMLSHIKTRHLNLLESTSDGMLVPKKELSILQMIENEEE